MANENLNYVFGADISAFQNAIKSVQSGLKETGDKLKDIGGDLSTYVSLPLAALGGAAIKAFGDIQSLKNGLTAVTGSAAETEKQFKRLTELAKLPGLGLQEVTKGSINLQVIGFTAEKAEKSIRAFGNAVATVGGGREQFERATYGLAQLANTDFPLGEDLNIIKDAIPQVTPLLKEAFGSARSDELKEMGVSSAQVVDAIVNGLSKLPPVAGGVNAAFENLKDGVFTNLAEVGEIINKNLDISALSDKIVDGISSITNWFKNLSLEVQKATLIFAGLAIVIPPILVGLGALMSTVLPALIAGFAALISPIGLVVVAIAGAAVMIVKNWDAVSAYFTSGEGSVFWDEVVGYANELWDNLKFIFNTVKATLISVWKTIGTNVIASVSGAFDVVKGVISTVLGVISGYVKIFASVIKGDWSGVWEGVKTLTTSLWNGILSVIKGSVLQVGNLMAAFFKMIGADSLAAGAENANGRISKMFNALQIPVQKATETVKDFKKELLGVGETSTSTKKTDTKATSKADSKNKDKIAQVYQDLEVGLKQIDSLFGTSFDDKAKKRIDEYQQAINNLIKNGVDPASEAIKKLQTLQQNNNLLGTYNKTVSAVAPLEKGQKRPEAKFDATTRVGDAVQTISDQKIKVLQLMDEMNQGITGSLNQGIASMGSGFADMVGQMASGTMTMGGVVSGLIGILGDMAQQIGKIAISTGVAMLGIKAAFKNPFTAIAAGVALMTLGAMVKGSIAKATGGDTGDSGRTPFAKGGIVSSPTNAVFGEYPSAGRGNPEVVTPLNNLKGMLSDIGGFGGGTAEFIVRGDALVAVLNNHNKRDFRTN
ncbi:tape measure protein [Pedobacter nyackensis]|uniref:tape measure protein n=1 Tax=Pedobacter nyackensis TaxID=475255 RepID=UPI00293079BD|nr:tape measure protein [Pedobacter nyackensis]